MKDLLSFLFKGELEVPPRVRRLEVVREKEKQEKKEPETTEPVPAQHKFQLIMFFSRILAAVLLLCVAGVFFLIFTGKTVPDFLPPIITAILGYFGGAISAYFGIKSS